MRQAVQDEANGLSSAAKPRATTVPPAGQGEQAHAHSDGRGASGGDTANKAPAAGAARESKGGGGGGTEAHRAAEGNQDPVSRPADRARGGGQQGETGEGGRQGKPAAQPSVAAAAGRRACGGALYALACPCLRRQLVADGTCQSQVPAAPAPGGAPLNCAAAPCKTKRVAYCAKARLTRGGGAGAMGSGLPAAQPVGGLRRPGLPVLLAAAVGT